MQVVGASCETCILPARARARRAWQKRERGDAQAACVRAGASAAPKKGAGECSSLAAQARTCSREVSVSISFCTARVPCVLSATFTSSPFSLMRRSTCGARARAAVGGRCGRTWHVGSAGRAGPGGRLQGPASPDKGVALSACTHSLTPSQCWQRAHSCAGPCMARRPARPPARPCLCPRRRTCSRCSSLQRSSSFCMR